MQALLAESHPTFSVHVFSRHPHNQNALPEKVTYHSGDLKSASTLAILFQTVQPQVVFHAASPNAVGSSSTDATKVSSFMSTNVDGTRNLLHCAAASGTVRAFVYSSSVAVVEAHTFSFISESTPLLTRASRTTDIYALSKAIADQMVLESNNPKSLFRTVCLRLCGTYGERDNQLMPIALQMMREGKHRWQIGPNTALTDHVSVENAAAAHLLAAKTLLHAAGRGDSPSGKDGGSDDDDEKVDGEAFFITDGAPIPFWSFMRTAWSALGTDFTTTRVTTVPSWLVLPLAALVEWLYWCVTLGRKRPEYFRRDILELPCLERTYSIRKAERRLGYIPADNMEDSIGKAAEWALRQEKDGKIR